MHIPQTPPRFSLLGLPGDDPGSSNLRPHVMGAVFERLSDTKYLHWEDLRHRQPPHDLKHEEWWYLLKLQRRALYRDVPLKDTDGNAFQYGTPDPILEWLHDIDSRLRGTIGMPDQITNRDTKDRYLVRSLVEEAITSSQIEGAQTTRVVAKEMIRTGRKPKDHSERMILNNYLTMEHIGEIQGEELTPELVLRVHEMVTEGTLEGPRDCGKLRSGDRDIVVGDMYGNVFHTAPDAKELPKRVAAMCDFANGKTPKTFVHPVIRSIILHFWLAYDHPFVDGNGRTARALFYWSMLHRGYWLCEFVTISRLILRARTKYGMAFLYTETDDNDLTYFIRYHLDVLRRAIDELERYVELKTNELQNLEQELRGLVFLNHRQRALMSHALRHPNHRYIIESHRKSQNVTYETARTDLLDLAKRELLHSEKVGREWNFWPVENLKEKLRNLS